MKFSYVFAPLALFSLAAAQDFACILNGREISVVDRDTGICEFPISDLLAVLYDYKNSSSFEATAYLYTAENGEKFYNDFAGKSNKKLNVPAIVLSETLKLVEWKLCAYVEGPGAPRGINSEEELKDELIKSESIVMPNWSPMFIGGHKVFP